MPLTSLYLLLYAVRVQAKACPASRPLQHACLRALLSPFYLRGPGPVEILCEGVNMASCPTAHFFLVGFVGHARPTARW